MTQWAIVKDGEFVLRLDECGDDVIRVRKSQKGLPFVTLAIWRQTEVHGRYENEPTVVDFVFNLTPSTAREIGLQLVKATNGEFDD